MQDETVRRAGLTRRDVMVGAGLSALTLTTGTGLADLSAVASGTVFEDRSGTGLRRTGDAGIPGVLVSNGRDVVAHRCRWTLAAAGVRWRQPVCHQAAALDDTHCRERHPALLLPAPAAQHAHEPTVAAQGRGADRHATGLDRFSPAAPARERKLRGTAARRSAARQRPRAGISARRHRRRDAAHRRRLRHRPRRCGGRRPLPLPALSAPAGRHRHSLASLPGQPRHGLGRAATIAPRARHGSACSARATTRSSTPVPPS